MTAEFQLDRYDRVTVVRDDTLDGGSKTRFLPELVRGAREVVFGGPFCGGAPWALAVIGKAMGFRVTLFYAERAVLHRRQILAIRAGATVYQVPHGYMTHVQAKAKKYAADHDALFLPLGFDVPAAVDAFTAQMRELRQRTGSPDEIWCATGSGMLARCLGIAFPDSQVNGVVVGLQSRNSKQSFTDNVRLHTAPYKFARECRYPAPFPCDPNYERKAYEMMQRHPSTVSRLFWNVAG